MLNFSEALSELKMGGSVLRYSSDIELKQIEVIVTDKCRGIYQVNYEDYKVPYTPSFEDLMAEDWYIVLSTFDTT